VLNFITLILYEDTSSEEDEDRGQELEQRAPVRSCTQHPDSALLGGLDSFLKEARRSSEVCTCIVKPVYSGHLGELVCWSYPDNEHPLKKTWDSIDDFENNVSSSTSCYWKLYFCLLNIFLYLFVWVCRLNFKAFLFTDVDDFDMMHYIQNIFGEWISTFVVMNKYLQ
jgi:hypothetical protein